MSWTLLLFGFFAALSVSIATWLLSLVKKDVSIVDSSWPLMFIATAMMYLSYAPLLSERNGMIFFLLLIWGARLFLHITMRGWGEPEDYRYQKIRRNYSPHFALKSLFIIFLFQAFLAWAVSLSLTTLMLPILSLSTIDYVAIMIVLLGIGYESVADYQLTSFKSLPENKHQVMDQGLWQYCRHPNYFGECLVWWGFYLFVVLHGPWWLVVSPLLITFLLLKFSGVALLESTITDRRPDYDHYIRTTNAFIPGPKHLSRREVL